MVVITSAFVITVVAFAIFTAWLINQAAEQQETTANAGWRTAVPRWSRSSEAPSPLRTPRRRRAARTAGYASVASIMATRSRASPASTAAKSVTSRG